MSLQAGTTLGSYEIVDAIGAGGMGEVYRARDTKLGREVAIKVLPADVTSEPDRLSRFEREARALAALNHPNVATLYGFETEAPSTSGAPIPFLVMELVEGETLSERLERGPIRLHEALPLFLGIAEGLEAAHDKGIVHRDLKPGNVKVIDDGTLGGSVKVLDFGLAKAMVGDASVASGNLSESPTLTMAATQRGQILGTAAYMAPEQARGKAVDRRADVWAFGACLYEALSGDSPFTGDTSMDVLSAVVSREPDWEALPAETPAGIVRLLKRCLVKEPRGRLQAIGDARLEVEEAIDRPERPATPATATSTARPWQLASLLLLVLSVVLLFRLLTSQPVSSTTAVGPATPVRRWTMDLSADSPLAVTTPHYFGAESQALVLSPDGSVLVYVVLDEQSTRLMLRRLDTLESAPLAGTEGAFLPFFSPDGQQLGFFTPIQLKKLSLRETSDPVALAEVSNPAGAVWTDDDTILAFTNEGATVHRVPANGGEPLQILEVNHTDDDWNWSNPQLLPGGDTLLVVAQGAGHSSVVAIASDSGERTLLVENARAPYYLPTGHLLYGDDTGLMAVPFNPESLDIGSTPVSILNNVRRGTLAIQFTIAQDGTAAWVAGGDDSVASLAWADRDGTVELLPSEPERFGTFRLSPDGTQVAIVAEGSRRPAVTIYDLERDRHSRETGEGRHAYPIWAPDGEQIVFWADFGPSPVADASERFAVMTKRTAGGAPEPLLSARNFMTESWSPDGRWLAGIDRSRREMLVVDTSDPGSSQLALEHGSGDEWGAAFAPNGHFIAYTSPMSGGYQVYVQPFPPTGEVHTISDRVGSEEPVWSHDGRELFYRNGDAIYGVEVSIDDEFEFSTPSVAFEGHFTNVAGLSYDVHPDGDRFLVLVPEEQPPATQIRIVQNFFEVVKQRAPVE